MSSSSTSALSGSAAQRSLSVLGSSPPSVPGDGVDVMMRNLVFPVVSSHR